MLYEVSIAWEVALKDLLTLTITVKASPSFHLVN